MVSRQHHLGFGSKSYARRSANPSKIGLESPVLTINLQMISNSNPGDFKRHLMSFCIKLLISRGIKLYCLEWGYNMFLILLDGTQSMEQGQFWLGFFPPPCCTAVPHPWFIWCWPGMDLERVWGINKPSESGLRTINQSTVTCALSTSPGKEEGQSLLCTVIPLSLWRFMIIGKEQTGTATLAK